MNVLLDLLYINTAFSRGVWCEVVAQYLTMLDRRTWSGPPWQRCACKVFPQAAILCSWAMP